MTDQADLLAQFSSALAARTEAAKNAIVAIHLPHGRHITGMVWQSDAVVASEQSLPRKDEFELVAPGGSALTAKIAGRDSSTNIAMLRLGLVNLAGPEWHSSRGGLIDRRIVLDVGLARREEGGPVFDATGGCLGMSTFGPRGQVIVIPTATIGRIAPQLAKDGRIARGWLGVALQAVAVPDALRESAEQSSGLMVMSVVEGGPAAQAGVLAGDIILSVDGTSTHRFRRIAKLFGSDSIGRKADIRLIRSGSVMSVQTTIAERRAA